jgi:hypothetical protein
MKVIKTPAKPTLNELFTVGNKMIFTQHHFDGRADTSAYHLVKVVKVNKVSVDVEFKNGTVVRLAGHELNDLDSVAGEYARLGAMLEGRN